MAWSVLQSNSATQATAATTFAVTYSNNLASGNILLAAVTVSGARTISSVKDTAANSFTLIGTVNLNNSSTRGVLSLYAIATPSGDVGTKPTITATLSTSTDGSIWIAEVSGIQITTDGSVGTGFGAAGAASPTYSDTAANEFFLTIFGDDGGPETASVTGGWTVDSKSINGNSNANCVVAYGNSTGGTESNSWTSTGTTTFCGALAVAFNLTSGGGPTVAQPLIVRAPQSPMPTTPTISPRVVPLLSSPTVSLMDSGAGSDSLSISIAVADSGAGSDTLSPTLTLSDSGTGTDTPSTTIPLSETAAGSDTVATVAALGDTGTGADTLSVAVTSFLPALLAAPPAPPQTPPPIRPFIAPPVAGAPTAVSLPDTGAGSDALSVTASVTLTDTGAGTDALSVSFTGQVSPLIRTPAGTVPATPLIAPQVVPIMGVTVPIALSDVGTGTDTMASAVTLTDTGSGAESVTLATSLLDAGTVAETLTLMLQLADSGSATDTLATPTRTLTLTDSGFGLETLTTGVSVADSGTGSDALTLPPAGNTGTTQWTAGALASRWTIKAVNRWTVASVDPRWRAVLMSGFKPIAAISLQEINVLWNSNLAGTIIDPTVGPLVVQMAFPVSSGNINAPAQPVTWYAASWLTGTTIKGWVAQCLVGPGGVVTLNSGQSYDVWSQIQGSPESPKLFAGVQQVY